MSVLVLHVGPLAHAYYVTDESIGISGSKEALSHFFSLSVEDIWMR